jgi:hypothetical protein
LANKKNKVSIGNTLRLAYLLVLVQVQINERQQTRQGCCYEQKIQHYGSDRKLVLFFDR